MGQAGAQDAALNDMDARILLVGPSGAGKSAAIKSVSAIAPVLTNAGPVATLGAVELETGVMDLGGGQPLMLYAAPGPDRLDEAWEELVDRCSGVLLLIDHAAPSPAAELRRYQKMFERRRGPRRPVVVAITHTDIAPHRPMTVYRDAVAWRQDYPLPIFAMDARKPLDVRAAVLTLSALLEMKERFGDAAAPVDAHAAAARQDT
jgi:hypothetical protein